MNLPDWFSASAGLVVFRGQTLKIEVHQNWNARVWAGRAGQGEFRSADGIPNAQVNLPNIPSVNFGLQGFWFWFWFWFSGFLVFWFSANPKIEFPDYPEPGMKFCLHQEIRLIKASWSVQTKIQNSNFFWNPNFGVTSPLCPCTVRKGEWAHNLLNF